MIELAAEHHRGRDLGIHHQVAAVADHHDHFALGPRHLHAEAAGDLVAHARVAVFDVVAAGRARAPELVQLAGQRAGGADDDVVAGESARESLHRADHVARRRAARPSRAPVRRATVIAPRASRRDCAARRPRRRRRVQPRERRASARRAPARASPTQRRRRATCAHRTALTLRLTSVRLREQRVRAGREVLQPRADREHHVGLAPRARSRRASR